MYLSRYSEVCQAKITLFIICASFVQVYHRQAMLYALTCLRASVTPQYQYSTPTAVWTWRVEGCLCSTVHAEMVARGLVRRNISTSSSYRLDDLNTSAMHFRVQSWLKVSWWLSLSFEMPHICSGIISRAALSARAP